MAKKPFTIPVGVAVEYISLNERVSRYEAQYERHKAEAALANERLQGSLRALRALLASSGIGDRKIGSVLTTDGSPDARMCDENGQLYEVEVDDPIATPTPSEVEASQEPHAEGG